VLAPAAYVAAFNAFAPYDDEGYFLTTLRDFVAGPQAFAHVSAVYGPVYYELIGGFFKLTGLPVTHDNGRYLTLAIWLAASVVQGVAVFRFTNRLWLGLCAQLVSFHVLAALAPEPLHPSCLVGLFIGGITLAASFAEARPRLSGALLGALCAALCLVKINTGVFAMIALAVAWTASRRGPVHRWGFPAVAGVAVVLPSQIMWGQIGQAWVLQFAIVATLSLFALYVASVPELLAGGHPPAAWPVVAAALGIGAFGVLLIYPAGWTPQDLFSGLRQAVAVPAIFVWPIRLNWAYPAWAVLAFGFLLAGGIMARPEARIVVGVAAWVCLLLLPSALFLFILPLCWLAAFRLSDIGGRRFAPLLLAWLAVTEVLQAYPVAGMQLSLAALGVVPIGALLIDGGLESRQASDVSSRWLAPALVAGCAAIVGLNGYLAASDYYAGAPAGLRGMNATRLPAAQAQALQATVGAVTAECTAFVTYPGLTSFYAWTGQPPPVPLEAGPWMFVVDDASQQAMVGRLRALPKLCVIRDQAMLDFWAQDKPVPDRPLVGYIESDFAVAASFGEYEVLVRR